MVKRRLTGTASIAVIVSVLLGLVAAVPAMAQEYRGNLYVEVTAKDGRALPGVALTLVGTGYERTVAADQDGKARFSSLQPGAYALTAKQPGFATTVLQDIQVNTLANITIPVQLSPSEEVTESVVVTAQTPLLDQRKTGTSTVLTQDELSEIPTSRDPWSVLSTVPGVTTDRVNVGGNEAGQQANFVTKGDDGRNATWIVDGVEVTDVGAIGSSATYYDFNSFDEIGFVTGGGDVEQPNGGARLNFVTKQGSNSTGGDARLWYAPNSLQSNIDTLTQPSNVDPANNPLPSNLINEVFEKNFDIGGPLWKDHMWYWFGFSQNDIDISVAGTSDKTKLKSTSFKLHGQFAGGKANWRAFYTNTNKRKDGRGAAVTRPIETTWNQKGPSPIYSGRFSWFFGSDWELSAQAAKVDGGFSLTPKGGLNAQIINDANNIWHGTFILYDTLRPQDQYTVKANGYIETGDWEQELKFGYRYKNATVESLSKWSNNDFFVYSGAYIFLYRERTLDADMKYDTIWASDTLVHGPWSINAGLTYTKQRGNNKPRMINDVGICPTCLPGLSYQGGPEEFDWTDISPRVGASYTFNTDRRILLRANYAQYVDQLNIEDIVYDNPGGQYVYTYTYWTDTNLNDQVDAGEFSTDCNDYLGGTVDPCNPLNFNFKIDPNYETPQTQEAIFGGEFEIAKDFTIAANLVWRKRDKVRWYEGNLDGRPTGYLGPLYDVPTYMATGELNAIPASGYDCTTMLTGSFPDGTPYSVPICDLNASGQAMTDAAGSTFLTNRPGYDQTYQGIEITATKRLSNKWMLRGFINYATWEQNFSGVAGISDPTNFQGGTTDDGGAVAVPSTGSGTKDGTWPGTSRWQVNVNALYQLPKNVSLSANFQAREGYGIPYYDRSGTKDVQVGAIDARRYDNLYLFDFKIAKTFHINTTLVELSAEVFNAFNDNTVLSRAVRVDQPTNTNAIRENLSPRIIRAGASIHF